MTTIRIRVQTHEQLKTLARQQGIKLTGLLAEIASLLTNYQLSPTQIQTKLTEAAQIGSFQKLLTEQVGKFIKVLGQQERNYLFPLSKELALIKEHTEHCAGGEEVISLLDIDERLQHLMQLIQANKEALDKLYQLLMEV